MVEFAICLPVLVVVSLGSIEACNAINLKQVATEAAYEAVRTASGATGTLLTAEARANEVLASHSITGATVQFTPASDSNWARGVDVTVTISVPSSNLGAVNFFFQSQSMQGSVTMVKL
ncbi:MAG: pilus assembly protein [Planctomycetales bacterium]|nr:pilus assembly protein [Planctomycetales bacterium]